MYVYTNAHATNISTVDLITGLLFQLRALEAEFMKATKHIVHIDMLK